MLGILGHGFGQSIEMVAAGLGITLDPELRTTHEMAVATAPIESPIGIIEPDLARRSDHQDGVLFQPCVVRGP